MPTDEEQRELALEELKLLVQDSVEPALSPYELSLLLDKTKRAKIWAASIAYAYGDVVVPVARNGFRYIVTKAGTSGTTEPTWPTSFEGTVINGTVTFEEAGLDYGNIYDVRAAAGEGWMLKAAKASANVDESMDLGSFRCSQVYEHCVRQAGRFRTVRVA